MIWPDPYRMNPDSVFEEMCGGSSNFDPTIRLVAKGDVYCGVDGETNPTTPRRTITAAMASKMPTSSLAYVLAQQQNKPVAAETAKPVTASEGRTVTNATESSSSQTARKAAPETAPVISGGGGGGGSPQTQETEPEKKESVPAKSDKAKPVLIIAGIAIALYLIS